MGQEQGEGEQGKGECKSRQMSHPLPVCCWKREKHWLGGVQAGLQQACNHHEEDDGEGPDPCRHLDLDQAGLKGEHKRYHSLSHPSLHSSTPGTDLTPAESQQSPSDGQNGAGDDHQDNTGGNQDQRGFTDL